MFNNYKEIVTKAVIGKGKKSYKNDYELLLDTNVDTVLGCWVINHDLKGRVEGDKIRIKGSYDINIWYSYDNNTKTNVASQKIFYDESVRVKVKENSDLSEDSEIIIRALKNPACTDVEAENNKIKYTISKELGIEIVGDTKVKIAVSENYDDYEIIEDDEEIEKEIEQNVNESYIKTEAQEQN